MRPAIKVGIVGGGFVGAFGLACLAVYLWQRCMPDQGDASSGMSAFGDLLVGLTVFSMLALAPVSLGLYWSRSFAGVWLILAWGAVLYAATGPIAVVASGWSRESAGNLTLLADARIGSMPLTALVLLAGGLFAPQPRWRRMLIGSALLDGAIFCGVVLVHFVLPRFAS